MYNNTNTVKYYVNQSMIRLSVILPFYRWKQLPRYSSVGHGHPQNIFNGWAKAQLSSPSF